VAEGLRIGEEHSSHLLDTQSSSQSFPRKRGSMQRIFGNPLSADWIPASAGMTGVWRGSHPERHRDRARILLASTLWYMIIE
jgi:hypothetical protein